MEKEYLSEEKYNKTKKILKTVGFISLSIGVILFVMSLLIRVPEMGQDGWFELESKKNHLRFLSFIFGLMLPMPMFFIAYGREIIAFQAQQTIPVAKEGIEKMAPTAGVVVKEITKGIKEGLNEVSNNEEK